MWKILKARVCKIFAAPCFQGSHNLKSLRERSNLQGSKFLKPRRRKFSKFAFSKGGIYIFVSCYALLCKRACDMAFAPPNYGTKGVSRPGVASPALATASHRYKATRGWCRGNLRVHFHFKCADTSPLASSLGRYSRRAHETRCNLA